MSCGGPERAATSARLGVRILRRISMLRQLRTLAWVVVTVLVVGGCASRGALFDRADSELQRGQPGSALQTLEPLADSSRNRSLYLLNRGMLLRMSGDLEGSIEAFEEAKRVIGRLDAISVSETLAAWGIAEDSGSYVPPTYEHLLLHAYQALNFLELGRLQEARVEALQIDLGLRRIDPVNGRAPHGGDAFPRYISGLIFEAGRDWSDALIAYRKAAESYERSGVTPPRDLQFSLLRLTDHLELSDERDQLAAAFGIERWPSLDAESERATLVVIVHDGQAPRLLEESLVVPQPGENRFIRVSLPYLQSRPSRLEAIRLIGDGGGVDGEPVEDVAANADRWLSALMPGLTARAVSRNVARNVATRRVEEESRWFGFLFNVVGTVLENADTRSWRTLPDRIHLLREELPPGETTLQLELLTGSDRVLQREQRTLNLGPGETTVISVHWIEGSLIKPLANTKR